MTPGANMSSSMAAVSRLVTTGSGSGHEHGADHRRLLVGPLRLGEGDVDVVEGEAVETSFSNGRRSWLRTWKSRIWARTIGRYMADPMIFLPLITIVEGSKDTVRPGKNSPTST